MLVRHIVCKELHMKGLYFFKHMSDNLSIYPKIKEQRKSEKLSLFFMKAY